MLSAADNELLTRTGPGVAMGAYFRRFWLPVALSRELAAPDGPPLRVRMLGEELLLFRDTAGRVGLVDSRCPHRGADLFFGRNEDCGLRCVYHGWKFDVDGQCVDVPNVPAQSAERMHVTITAYPTQEFGDIVWAYLGPHRPPPDVPQLEFGLVPPEHRYVTKKLQSCNWAQAIEGAMDTSHFSFLHMPAPGAASNDNPYAQADPRRLRWLRDDPLPQFSFVDHEVGFLIGGARKADGNDLYWRTTNFMLPAHATVPSTEAGEFHIGHTFVPVSDERCCIYNYVWHPERPLTEQERTRLRGGFGPLAEVGPDFVPLRNRANNYAMDRDDQKHRTYTGIRGVAEQDAMIQESQGPISDRTREHLVASDAPIARFRRTILAGAKALQEGQEPSAPRNAAAYTLRSGSHLADAALPLEEVMRLRFGDPTGRIRPQAAPPIPRTA